MMLLKKLFLINWLQKEIILTLVHLIYKLNIKQTKQLENKIPDVSSLATKTALTAVENEIPEFSSLVKETNHNTKIN